MVEQLNHFLAEFQFWIFGQFAQVGAVGVLIGLLPLCPHRFCIVAVGEVIADVLLFHEFQGHLSEEIACLVKLVEGQVFGADEVVEIVVVEFDVVFDKLLERVVAS